MKIIIIGAGNLATNLGKALQSAGHDICQVYSRTQQSAEMLAAQLHCAFTTDMHSVGTDADVYIFSVKDSCLADLIPVVCKGREEKVFCHTAGSMPMDVFKGMALHYGVIYPMQTFSRQREVDFRVIPCFLEASDPLTESTLQSLATSVSERVLWISTEQRRYLHLSAVFACNFVNHCYAMASDLLEKQHIPFDVLLPLIDETASKVHALPPADAQTGPAVRYDENVIRAQGSLLQGVNPALKDIYDRMSMSIHTLAEQRAKQQKTETSKQEEI